MNDIMFFTKMSDSDMKTRLFSSKTAGVDAVNSSSPLRHFGNVRSLVACASVVFLAVMPAIAQTSATDHFVLKITTTAGININSADKDFTFYSHDTDYMVDWGEGSGFEQVTTGNAPHTFATAGVKTIPE